MADKRMFTKKITESDAFLDMPLSAQALYFHLNMNADDDGFINNPKMIARLIGATNKDVEILIDKKFLLAFESGVVVVKAWHMNNIIKADRRKPTPYQEELAMLDMKDNRSYTWKHNGNILETDWNINGNNCFRSIDKIRLDKNRLDNSILTNTIGLDCKSQSIPESEVFAKLPIINNQFYTVYQKDVEEWKTSFPAVDVEQEIRNAIEWIKGNPKNVKKNGKRYLTNWLIRSQEKARAHSERNKSGVNYIDIE